MSDTDIPAAKWPRPYWTAGDEHTVLLFFVFGKFNKDLRIPAARHGSKGLPEGIELFRYPRETLEQWEGYPLHGALGEMLRQDHPTRVRGGAGGAGSAERARQPPDPHGLDYLYDTLGVIAGLMDIGGVAVADPQILSLFDRETWMQRFMVEGGAAARDHVLILCNDDEQPRRCGLGAHPRHAQVRAPRRQHPRRAAKRDRCRRRAVHAAGRDAGAGRAFEDGQELEIDGLPAVLGAAGRQSGRSEIQQHPRAFRLARLRCAPGARSRWEA